MRPTRKPAAIKPEQRRHLGDGEDILHHGAGADAARVAPGEEDDDGDGHQLLRGQPDLARADQIVLIADPGKEDAGVLGEGHRHRRDGAGLDHHEERPAVEEAVERAEGFAQVDVLAAGVRHGRGQFAVAERRDQGEDRGDEPGHHHQAGRLHLARDIGGDDEDAGADHRAHHQGGGIDQAEAFDQTAFTSLCHSSIRSRSDARAVGCVGQQSADHGHRIGAGAQHLQRVLAA